MSGGKKAGLAIGLIIIALVVIVAVVLVVLVKKRRRRRLGAESNEEIRNADYCNEQDGL